MSHTTLLAALGGIVIMLAVMAFYLRKTSRIGAAYALLLAVGLGGLTAVGLWPALTNDATARANADLRQRLAEARSIAADVSRERDRLAAETQSLSAAVTSANDAHRRLQASSAMTLDRIEMGMRDLYSRIDRPESPIAFDHARRPDVRSNLPNDQRTDALLVDLDGLKGLRAKPTTAAISNAGATRDLMRLKDRMATTVKTDNYDIEIYPAKDLVAGRTGKYYVVDLKNAASGIRYFFEGGKYTLKTSSGEFRSSMNAFVSDVLAKIDGKVAYDLFVRGSADQKPFQGRLDPEHPIRAISFLKQVSGDRYASDPTEVRYDGAFKNEDLPNLRAAFLRQIIADVYPVKAPHVLEGSVTRKIDERDRNAELILFVDW